MRAVMVLGTINSIPASPARPAVISAEQGHRVQAGDIRRRDGGDDVFGIAAGADGQEDVAFLAERADLPREDFVVTVVVADGGEQAAARREIQRRGQRWRSERNRRQIL